MDVDPPRPWTEADGLIGAETICHRRTAIGGGHISSRRPRGDTFLSQHFLRVTRTLRGLRAAISCNARRAPPHGHVRSYGSPSHFWRHVTPTRPLSDHAIREVRTLASTEYEYLYSPTVTARHTILQHCRYKNRKTQTRTQLKRLIRIKNVNTQRPQERVI